MPGLLSGFAAMLRRDLLLAMSRPGDVLNPVIFFLIISSLFPLALGADEVLLAAIGPGVVWVAALLATLLSVNSLYLIDLEDGTLDQMLLSPQPLPILVLAKATAQWLVNGVPLVIAAPLIGYSYGLDGDASRVMIAALALGTVSLSLLGSVGAALTVGLHRGTALLSLLVLPLAIPVLMFGARTVALAIAGDSVSAGLYFLAAYCMLALSFAPFAAAAALRISND